MYVRRIVLTRTGGAGMTESNDRDDVLIARPQEYLVRFNFQEARCYHYLHSWGWLARLGIP